MKYQGTAYENPIPGCSTDNNMDFSERLNVDNIESVPIEIFDEYPFLRDFIENSSGYDENGLTLEGNEVIFQY